METSPQTTHMMLKTHKLEYIALYLLCFILALMVFSPWLNNYFSSDDWPVISRNLHVSWPKVPSWFITIRFGWYRPLYEVFVALSWQLFGLNPLGYRLLSVAIYALVAANVGITANLLVRDKGIAVCASILFCILAPHAEPVLWFAAANESGCSFCHNQSCRLRGFSQHGEDNLAGYFSTLLVSGDDVQRNGNLLSRNDILLRLVVCLQDQKPAFTIAYPRAAHRHSAIGIGFLVFRLAAGLALLLPLLLLHGY